jgi:hypothetical protein
MPLAELAEYTRCMLDHSGIAQGIARAQTGELNPCDELAGQVYAAPAVPAPSSSTWIATDDYPREVERWVAGIIPPPGWHIITASEAQTLQKPTTISFLPEPVPAPTDLASQAAALSYVGASPPAVRDREPSRTPRRPRPPRAPREARTPRAPRPGRAPRAPRSRRPARPPRAKRIPRKERPRRPRAYKTKQPPGVCKGPGCTCWTPAGCTGSWYLELVPWFKDSDCFKGACYDYTACVTGRCSIHPACLIATILQFWARQYRAVVANPIGAVTDAAKEVTTEAKRLGFLVTHAAEIFGFREVGPEPWAVTEGCPPGTRWAVGLTGFSCQTPATHPTAATREQLIAAGILRA